MPCSDHWLAILSPLLRFVTPQPVKLLQIIYVKLPVGHYVVLCEL